MRWLLLVMLAGCASRGAATANVTLRPACAATERWDGAACIARTATAALDASEVALAEGDLDAVDRALARAAAEPLDHASHVRLWEQRGIAAAYRMYGDETPDKVAATAAAYGRLLALDPTHHLDCRRADKATTPFERARIAAASGGGPALQVTWPRNLRLGEPVPLELETVADPDALLHAATVYIRHRGATTWRATDVTLAPTGGYTRIRVPGVDGTEPTALELYATATDRAGNETLLWASAQRPREVPLRYDPPTPWFRTWWVWAIAGGVVATGAGVATYALVWEPSSQLDGTITR